MKPVRASLMALMLLAGGCAATPPPQVQPLAKTEDPRIAALHEAVQQAMAHEPQLARRYEAAVTSVEESGATLLFTLDLMRQASFGREARVLSLVTTCTPGEPDECVRKIMDAIRAADRL